MDEDEGLEPTPAERLGEYLKSLKARFADRSQQEGALPAKPANTFWRELAVTIALLLLWGAVAAVPVPVVRWHALRSFGVSFGWAGSRFSIITLGLGPYIIAHWLVFWFVMAVPRLRRMDFRYRLTLNKYVLSVTFLLVAVQAWGIATWYKGMVSPRGERILLPYFAHHPHALQAATAICLGAGVAFTLVVLALIQRYGIPCAVTCMIIWTAFASLSLFRQVWYSLKYALTTHIGMHQPPAGWLRICAGIFLVILLTIFALATLVHMLKDSAVSRLLGRLSRQGALDPEAYIFSTLSIGLLVGVFDIALAGLNLVNRYLPLNLPDYQRSMMSWKLGHPGIRWIAVAALVVPSALIAYRLLYNPSLRHRLGEALGLDESSVSLKTRARGSLLLWCGFAVFVTLLCWPRQVLGEWSNALSFLFSIGLWDVVLLVLTVVLLRRFYRLRAAGLRCPVLSHGYYEPLYAARAFLAKNGIRSQIWGEPFAMLFGFIVGPIGFKRLLVSEADLDRAAALLQEKLDGAPSS